MQRRTVGRLHKESIRLYGQYKNSWDMDTSSQWLEKNHFISTIGYPVNIIPDYVSWGLAKDWIGAKVYPTVTQFDKDVMWYGNVSFENYLASFWYRRWLDGTMDAVHSTLVLLSKVLPRDFEKQTSQGGFADTIPSNLTRTGEPWEIYPTPSATVVVLSLDTTGKEVAQPWKTAAPLSMEISRWINSKTGNEVIEDTTQITPAIEGSIDTIRVHYAAAPVNPKYTIANDSIPDDSSFQPEENLSTETKSSDSVAPKPALRDPKEFWTGTVADIDGNVYHTIKIGSQVWMAENLRVARFNNGDKLPNISAMKDWTKKKKPAFCYYDNKPQDAAVNGCLYNGYVVSDKRSIAPKGWHVPSKEEWIELEKTLGGENVAGGKLKETGTVHWTDPNGGATNEFGFSAIGTGCRTSSGWDNNAGSACIFWSSSAGNEEIFTIEIDNGTGKIYAGSHNILCGVSVRCVKDK